MDQAVQLAGVLKLVRGGDRHRAREALHPDQLLGPHLTELERLEDVGDRGVREALASLFDGGVDPMVVIRWKDLFERLEQAIDACEHVAHVLEGIRPQGDLSTSPVLGCIDIGSNTTRLLVAQCEHGSLRELASQRAFTRIGKSLQEGRPRFPGRRSRRSRTVVAAQARAARESGVQQLVTVATAAIRDAPNRVGAGRCGSARRRRRAARGVGRRGGAPGLRRGGTHAGHARGGHAGRGRRRWRLDRDRGGRGRRPGELVGVLSHRLGLPRGRLPALRPSGGRRAGGGPQSRGGLLRGPGASRARSWRSRWAGPRLRCAACWGPSWSTRRSSAGSACCPPAP